jgi:hypothetical protein
MIAIVPYGVERIEISCGNTCGNACVAFQALLQVV